MNVVVGAVACVWLGMVLGISFLEAPLKFRAGITLALGLGIGRLVFAALNRVEAVLAVVVLVAAVLGPHPLGVVGAAAVGRPRWSPRSYWCDLFWCAAPTGCSTARRAAFPRPPHLRRVGDR